MASCHTVETLQEQIKSKINTLKGPFFIFPLAYPRAWNGGSQPNTRAVVSGGASGTRPQGLGRGVGEERGDGTGELVGIPRPRGTEVPQGTVARLRGRAEGV